MDLKQLNYFIAVVENDFNLSKTSKKLKITQPTLSQMIIDLEKEYEIKLFEKEFGRFKRLTKIGEKFYRNAKRIMNQVEKLNFELKLENDLFRGRVRIGIPPLILSFLCLNSIPAFIKDNPDIHLEVVEDNAYNLYKMLQKNEIDLAIITEPINHVDIITKPIYSDRIICYLNDDHHLAKFKAVHLKDLSKEKMMTFNDNFIIFHQILKSFKENDLDVEFYFQSGQWDLVVHMAKNLNGIALIPKPFTELDYISNVTAIDIKPTIPWEIVIAYNQHSVKTSDTRKAEDFFTNYYK